MSARVMVALGVAAVCLAGWGRTCIDYWPPATIREDFCSPISTTRQGAPGQLWWRPREEGPSDIAVGERVGL